MLKNPSSLLKLFLLINVVILMAGGIFASPPDNTPGKKAPVAEWYFPEWLGSSPYSPSFEVKDTTNKYGRYATQTKTITLKDLIKFHGHFCGGLVESAGALRVAFDTPSLTRLSIVLI